ncbi:MAG: ThuA domain-containing protein [Myxococcota bacterium]|jgi:type 1 glutamine amidotransferase
MSFIRYGSDLEILVVTKGHPFERDPFFGIFDAIPDIGWSAVEQPAAQSFFTPERAKHYDAYVLYDMPGVEFSVGGPRFHDPPAEYVRGFLDLLETGHGFVFLHHAIAGWPSWPEYADIIGGRFLYGPGEVNGRDYPASGYRHAVKHRLRSVAPGHRVTEGLEEGFEIEDELYLFPVNEAQLTPLLRSDHEFVDSEFYSAQLAVQGEMFSREGWSHPPGSDFIAWTHRYRNSPIVYIACGDGPDAYQNQGLRRLISNAIHYVAAQAGD